MAFSTIQGSGGAPDSFVGTSGVDAISFTKSTGNFFLGAQEANDVVNFVFSQFDANAVTSATLRMGAGDDSLTANGATFNSVFANGNAGADAITFTGVNQAVTVLGGQGADVMTIGAATSSSFNGNRDNDTLTIQTAGAASSYLGGQGNDTINVNANALNSLIDGSLGDDSVILGAFSVAGSTITGAGGNDSINGAAATTAINADGGEGNDSISAGAFANTIAGGEGNDTITAAGGNNTITAGDGNDAVTTFAGDDTISLGAGIDVVNAGSGANQISDAGNGVDTIVHNTAVGVGVVNTLAATITGTSQVTLTATVAGASATAATGVFSNVTAATSTAAVTLTGNTGNDIFVGGTATDTIAGGAGTDTITGGAAADSMTGGAGADRFIQTTGQAATTINGTTFTFANGADVVSDFNSGQGDILQGGTALSNANIQAGAGIVAGTYLFQGTWNGATFVVGNGAGDLDLLYATVGADANPAITAVNNNAIVLDGGFTGFAVANNFAV